MHGALNNVRDYFIALENTTIITTTTKNVKKKKKLTDNLSGGVMSPILLFHENDLLLLPCKTAGFAISCDYVILQIHL